MGKRRYFYFVLLLIAIFGGCIGCGVSIDEDAIIEIVEDTIKDKVKDHVYEELGLNGVITYVCPEAIDGPEEQAFKIGTSPKITSKRPTRDGYHFIGWTRIQGEKEPMFFSGVKSRVPLGQDTTFYACWEKYNPQDPFEVEFFSESKKNLFDKGDIHEYKVKTEQNEKVVKIYCSCGLEVVDRKMTLDTFVQMATDGKWTKFVHLRDSQKEKYKKQHVMYQVHDYGPAVISLIGSLYKGCDFSRIDNIRIHFDVLEEFFDTMELVSEVETAYGESKYLPEVVQLKGNQWDHTAEGYTIEYVLRKYEASSFNREYRKGVTDCLSRAIDVNKYAGLVVGIIKGIHDFHFLMDNESAEMIDKLPIFTKTMSSIVAYLPTGGIYYGAMFDTLAEGLELYIKCKQYEDKIYALYDVEVDNCGDIFGGVLTTSDVEQARLKNFINDKGIELPTVAEVLDAAFVLQDDGTILNRFDLLSESEKKVVAWYLSMRMEYDFQRNYGLSLEEYSNYLK